MSVADHHREVARRLTASAWLELEYIEEGLCGDPAIRRGYAANYAEQAAKLFKLANTLDRIN